MKSKVWKNLNERNCPPSYEKTYWKMFEYQSPNLSLRKQQQISSKNDNYGFCLNTPRILSLVELSQFCA